MGRFWRDRLKSFGYAIDGLRYLFCKEGNAKVHLMATLLVVVTGFLFRISAMEWTAILLCVGMVICGEALNTAIEKVCDKVSPQRDPLIKIAKDVAAAGVLVLAVVSVIIAAIIFGTKIILIFK